MYSPETIITLSSEEMREMPVIVTHACTSGAGPTSKKATEHSDKLESAYVATNTASARAWDTSNEWVFLLQKGPGFPLTRPVMTILGIGDTALPGMAIACCGMILASASAVELLATTVIALTNDPSSPIAATNIDAEKLLLAAMLTTSPLGAEDVVASVVDALETTKPPFTASSTAASAMGRAGNDSGPTQNVRPQTARPVFWSSPTTNTQDLFFSAESTRLAPLRPANSTVWLTKRHANATTPPGFLEAASPMAVALPTIGDAAHVHDDISSTVRLPRATNAWGTQPLPTCVDALALLLPVEKENASSVYPATMGETVPSASVIAVTNWAAFALLKLYPARNACP
eukprot:Opistho-2@96175